MASLIASTFVELFPYNQYCGNFNKPARMRIPRNVLISFWSCIYTFSTDLNWIEICFIGYCLDQFIVKEFWSMFEVKYWWFVCFEGFFILSTNEYSIFIVRLFLSPTCFICDFTFLCCCYSFLFIDIWNFRTSRCSFNLTSQSCQGTIIITVALSQFFFSFSFNWLLSIAIETIVKLIISTSKLLEQLESSLGVCTV